MVSSLRRAPQRYLLATSKYRPEMAQRQTSREIMGTVLAMEGHQRADAANARYLPTMSICPRNAGATIMPRRGSLGVLERQSSAPAILLWLVSTTNQDQGK